MIDDMDGIIFGGIGCFWCGFYGGNCLLILLWIRGGFELYVEELYIFFLLGFFYVEWINNDLLIIKFKVFECI